MIVVATDAPLDTRNLKRLAKRAFLGLGKTGGIASNGSGDYVIAFSTAEDLRVSYQSNSKFEHQKYGFYLWIHSESSQKNLLAINLLSPSLLD